MGFPDRRDNRQTWSGRFRALKMQAWTSMTSGI